MLKHQHSLAVLMLHNYLRISHPNVVSCNGILIFHKRHVFLFHQCSYVIWQYTVYVTQFSAEMLQRIRLSTFCTVRVIFTWASVIRTLVIFRVVIIHWFQEFIKQEIVSEEAPVCKFSRNRLISRLVIVALFPLWVAYLCSQAGISVFSFSNTYPLWSIL